MTCRTGSLVATARLGSSIAAKCRFPLATCCSPSAFPLADPQLVAGCQFQDEVGKHGFSLLGHHITNAPQTALAFTGTIGTFCGFFLTAPGGWIADRFPHQRAQLLFVSAFLQTACPIVNAYWPDFTFVCATTLFSGLTGGLTSTCGRAITADCVPVDPVTGVPNNPARDFMVASYASIIPSLIIPVRRRIRSHVCLLRLCTSIIRRGATGDSRGGV